MARRRSLLAEIAAAGTPEGRRETARVHAEADARCGRSWAVTEGPKAGCGCAACRLVRAEIVGQNAATMPHGGKRDGAGRKPAIPGVSRSSPALPSVRVPEEIARRYASAAMREGRSVADVVRGILIERAPRDDAPAP